MSICFLLFVLSGCLDIEQTLTIEADGSGTLEVRYIFDEKALDLEGLIDLEDEFFTESELVGMIDTTAVSLVSFSESRSNGLRIVDMVYSFQDIEVLGARWCDDHNIILFDRAIDHSILTWEYAAGEPPKKETDEAMKELNALFSDHYCTFTVVAPSPITQADESASLSADRRTAKWRFPMASFMEGDTLSINVKFDQ